jgi:muconolactone delta-isomerase
MEFLVEFDVEVPDGTSETEIQNRMNAEADAAASLARHGQLLRLWRPTLEPGESRSLGLYRAEGRAELDALLGALPLDDWMRITVTELGPHPNDPASPRPGSFRLPDPRLHPLYQLDATLGEPVDLGDSGRGRRRIVPLTGGTFTGPTISGKLLSGASADWQTVLPDGTAIADVRYTLVTSDGDMLYVQARGTRHGSADVLSRLARGENVDASEYMFRTHTEIETAAPELDWLNKGVFVSVGGRQPSGVVYETYLVG